jgi:hypothetical protein
MGDNRSGLRVVPFGDRMLKILMARKITTGLESVH